MNRFVRTVVLAVSSYLMTLPAAADDLENMLNSRRQVLNQFNGGNATTPSSPATAPMPVQTRPAGNTPITVQKLVAPSPSSSRAAAILNGQNPPAASPTVQTAVPRAANYRLEGGADDLIRSAMGLIGVAYRWGGTSVRTGFDCSGFMQHIFRNSLGVNLPRTSAMQAKMGTHVNRSDLQPGDMVFFRTARGRISHVGLFIGNNSFIHAPRTGKRIEITSLSNKYWNRKYAFGRRVKRSDPARFLN